VTPFINLDEMNEIIKNKTMTEIDLEKLAK
jgi:hypothetical protein